MIMDDDVCDSSTMEQVIETILLIIKSKEENIDKGINLVLESTSEMMKRAEDWAIILHTQFLFDKKLKDRYIECVKRNKHKKTIIEITSKFARKKSKNRELAELLKEYSAIISYGHCSELRILVCAGDSEDVEKYPIIFEDSFDENEIYDLLRKNRKRIEEIIEREVAEAVPEGELSQPDDQAGSMADHFH